jgi:energy-coupling factor transporter ATP-binding protein EcfA2
MKLNWIKNLLGENKEKSEKYIHIEPSDKGQLSDIKELIANSESETAIEKLKDLNIVAIEKEVLTLSSRFQELLQNKILGVLSIQDYSIQLNKINIDVLEIVNLVEKSIEPEKIILEIKEILIKSYHKRLEDKLADRQPINIQCAYSLEGTENEHANIAYDEIVLKQEDVQENLETIFIRHKGRLLIIGEPGAGKTTLLLQLAVALLKRKENRVPVILNLSTWKNQDQNFNHWLKENLPTAASVNKALANKLIEEDKILLLFDGLDEVSKEYRRSCLDAIAEYGSKFEHQYVICSRVAEYTELGEAPVYGQIKVLPLRREQIIAQLNSSEQPEARFLLDAIQNQPLLAKVVENPFYFNTLQLLLSSMKSFNDLKIQAETEETLKGEIVEKFVEHQLNKTVNHSFPPEKSRKWLNFLAYKMNQDGIVRFELVDLTLKWLKAKWLYFSLGVFYFFLIFLFLDFSGISRILHESFFGSFILKSNLPSPFLMTSSYNYGDAILNWNTYIIIWLFVFSGRFKTIEKITWHFENIILNYKKNLLDLSLVFIYLFLTSLASRVSHISNITIILFSIGYIALILYLFRFFTFLLLLYFILTLLAIIFNVRSTNEFSIFITIVLNNSISLKAPELIKKAYVRIYRTFCFEILILLLISITITFTLNINFFLLFIDFTFSYLPFFLIFRHFVLRLSYAITGKLPFQLINFLNEMDKRHIFESDGGSWRFRHKIIQDYFVALR